MNTNSDASCAVKITHWSFADKVVLITGAARGIGKTIATSFGKAGAQVVIADLNRSSAEATVNELRALSIAVEYFSVDLAQKGEPERLVEAVARRFGRLDVLINNARGGSRLDLNEEAEDNWDLALTVGLRAANFASRAALPLMQANGGGAIVNISSIAAQLVTCESASYHAAKAGLMQLTRFLAVNAGPKNVRVNAVLPGFIVQDEHQARFYGTANVDYRTRAEGCHPLGRVGSSGDVAQTVLFLCSEDARFITGQAIVIDGGFSLRDAWTVMASLSNVGGKS